MTTKSPRRPELPDNEAIRVAAYTELGKLDSLSSPIRISWYLRDLGLSGTRFDCMSCPLGNYISRQLGGRTQTWVSKKWLCVYSDSRARSVWRVPISLGPYGNVREFVRRFDMGSYELLIDNVVALH